MNLTDLIRAIFFAIRSLTRHYWRKLDIHDRSNVSSVSICILMLGTTTYFQSLTYFILWILSLVCFGVLRWSQKRKFAWPYLLHFLYCFGNLGTNLFEAAKASHLRCSRTPLSDEEALKVALFGIGLFLTGNLGAFLFFSPQYASFNELRNPTPSASETATSISKSHRPEQLSINLQQIESSASQHLE